MNYHSFFFLNKKIKVEWASLLKAVSKLVSANQCSYIRAIHILSSYIGSGTAAWGSTHLELYTKVHLECPSTNDRAGITPWARQPLAKKVPRGACFCYYSTGQCREGNQELYWTFKQMNYYFYFYFFYKKC